MRWTSRRLLVTGRARSPIRCQCSTGGALAIENAILMAELEERVSTRTAALEEANKELEAFSYTVSHDLRAPLRAIDGFSEALLTDCGAQLDDRGRDYLGRVRSGAQRMSALIDDLLDLARIHRTRIAPQPIDLGSLARAVLDEIRAREPTRRVDIAIGDGLSATGDPRLMTIVLENLLGNAWKFTARSPDARIAFDLTEDRTAFYVRDNGTGFDMAHVGRLFTPFQRLHDSSEFEGTGIGLATVQRILSRHGGRIWAEAAPGQGATFYFTLGQRPAEH
jgi:signal transduction histidine kinase